MTELMFACVAALALAACVTQNYDGSGAALSKLTEFKDKMCACKTPACAQAVADDRTKWSQAMAKETGGKPPKWSDEEAKKVAQIGQDLAKCQADATKPAEKPPVPDATGSGSPGSATK